MKDKANQTILNILGLGHLRHVVSVRLSLRPDRYPVARIETHVAAGDGGPTPLFKAFELQPILTEQPSALDRQVSAALERLKHVIAGSASKHAAELFNNFRLTYVQMMARHDWTLDPAQVIGSWRYRESVCDHGEWRFQCYVAWKAVAPPSKDEWRVVWSERQSHIWHDLVYPKVEDTSLT